MLGRKKRDQLELFITGSLRQLFPDDHILSRVDRVLDLSWLRDEVADLYCTDNGRPGINPEVAVRPMLAGFLLGIIHDRRLLREAQVNLAIRWFVGYGLHELLPDYSSLTRIRQRWGADRSRNIFKRTVRACIAARIATGEIVHIDASLIRECELGRFGSAQCCRRRGGQSMRVRMGRPSERQIQKDLHDRPDATMATNGRNRRLEPSYKQHAAVDDVKGVVVDVEVTTGEENEGMAVEAQLDAIAMTTGVAIKTATMDAGYAYAKLFRALEDRQIDAIVPAKAERQPGKVMPTRRL
nr:transposase [Bradyrhizobium sp. LMTR 3]